MPGTPWARGSLLAGAILLGWVGMAFGQNGPDHASMAEGVPHFEPLSGFSILTGRRGAGAARAHVSFHAFGRQFELLLRRTDLFVPGAHTVWVDEQGVVEEPVERAFYRGRLRGEPHSWVRVAMRHGFLDGVVWTPNEIYFVEPGTRLFANPDDGRMFAYRLSDLQAEPAHGLCGVMGVAGRAGKMRGMVAGVTAYERFAAALRAIEVPQATREMGISLVADYEYFSRYGATAASDMQSLVNQIGGLYESELGVALRVVHGIVYSSSEDPFSDSTDPRTLRRELGSLGEIGLEADATLLFTGRDLDSSDYGPGWIGPGCRNHPRAGRLPRRPGRGRRFSKSGGQPPRASPTATVTPEAQVTPTPTANAGWGAAFTVAQAMSVNGQAVAAIGQPHLVSNTLNQPDGVNLFYPYDVARDPSVSQSRFYIADTFNSRVLGFECAGASCILDTFSPASRVFGQPDFASYRQNGGLLGGVDATGLNLPRGVAVDGSGALYVADTDNNRVLIYHSPWDDSTADVVIGQSSMSGALPGSGLNRLRAPEGLYVDSAGALWVADTGNDRVLKFASLTNGASAAFAIGGSGAASATTLSRPCDVALDAGGSLFAADSGFSRVLRYAAPLSGGMAASTVFGHGGSMTNGSANQGGVSAGSLAFPEKLHIDSGGRLWVADTGNQRTLAYDTPLASQVANRVFGQADRNQTPSFTTNVHDAPDGFPSAAGFWGPRGLDFDTSGVMWLCDRDNSRVMGFENPLAAPPSAIVADRVLGKQNFVSTFANGPTAGRVNNPVGVAVDSSQSPNRLWVVDIGNNRVLGYNSTADIVNDRPADIVLGQPSFTDGATNANLNGPLQNAASAIASASSLFFPVGVAVDSQGGVYVGDTSNSRVLHFQDPFGTETVADRVFGQGSFSSRNPSFPYGTASSLAGVGGVSIGPGDSLWVADTLDHRVVRFSDAPSQPSTGASADLVLGQAGFVSSFTFPAYSPGCAANRMNGPLGVFAAASGRVHVADSGNHRVLVFAPPFSDGMSASAVFGQASYSSCGANRGGAPGASTLNNPQGAYEDGDGTVFIADAGNNRVLVYDAPFGGGDLVADDVIGQPDFSTTAVARPAPDTLSQPSSVAMDTAGRLFVADRENSRGTRYAPDAPPTVLLDPIPSPLVVGDFNAITGSGFTAGSVIAVFVATSSGAQQYGPYSPDGWTSGSLVFLLSPLLPLGNGFATLMVVNTDQGYIQSNTQGQMLYGAADLNIPTITTVNGVSLNPADPSVPLANVETVITQGSTVTIGGTGFNDPLVSLFTATGNMGPLAPLAGATSSQLQVTVPVDTTTGPGSFQVINSPYTGNVQSNAVSVPIGERIRVDGVSQAGSTITVTGAGFSPLTVISFFNLQGETVVNLGGLVNGSQSLIPLTLISSAEFTFQIPAGAVSGPAYVQALNPPFIPFSSSGNDPGGAFTLVVPS